MRSMTGYGRGDTANEAWQVCVEIKAVNHRYSEVTIKQPRQLLALEDKMKKQIAQSLERGKIDVFVRLQAKASADNSLQIDQERAIAYSAGLAQLAEALHTPYTPDLYALVQLPDVLTHNDDLDLEAVQPLVEEALTQALANHVEMRIKEGNHIHEDLIQKVEELQGLAAQVEERSPLVLKDYQEKLHARIEELLGDTTVDADRLAQEVAWFAEKSCIDEELVRLGSHFKQFLGIMNESGGIGRKLDFLLQEMNRETNTIGSKANDLTIGKLVVEMKSTLEKLREQVQNIE